MFTSPMRLLLLASLCALSGCMTTYSVRPDKLTALDGFNAATAEGRVRVVASTDGEKVEYSQGRKLWLERPNGHDVGGEFKRIDLREGLLVGVLMGGVALSLDPIGFKTAKVSYVSVWKTVLLVTILTSLTVGLGFGAVVLTRGQWFPGSWT